MAACERKQVKIDQVGAGGQRVEGGSGLWAVGRKQSHSSLCENLCETLCDFMCTQQAGQSETAVSVLALEALPAVGRAPPVLSRETPRGPVWRAAEPGVL